MKHKFLLIILSLFLIGSATAQENVISEGHGTKAIFDDPEPISSIQIAQGDKSGVFCLDAYVSGSDGIPNHHFKNSTIDQVHFWIDYTATFNLVDVRFHYIIIGPGFFETYTTDWYTARYNNYSWVWLRYSNPAYFPRGTYTVIVIAEMDKNRGAQTTVAKTNFRKQ